MIDRDELPLFRPPRWVSRLGTVVLLSLMIPATCCLGIALKRVGEQSTIA